MALSSQQAMSHGCANIDQIASLFVLDCEHGAISSHIVTSITICTDLLHEWTRAILLDPCRCCLVRVGLCIKEIRRGCDRLRAIRVPLVKLHHTRVRPRGSLMTRALHQKSLTTSQSASITRLVSHTWSFIWPQTLMYIGFVPSKETLNK